MALPRQRNSVAGSTRVDADFDAEDGIDLPDDRPWLERALLPPGTTLPRVASCVTFFVTLYCFVFTLWYIAVAGDVCASERAAADQAAAEVERLRAELKALQGGA
mmetsp:Transcript_4904/g.9587  ORF Transcript_4904/g.9587 Transcript_4904/m.9587 type:complete len:105 (+) Transcript_4904:156-470(+)